MSETRTIQQVAADALTVAHGAVEAAVPRFIVEHNEAGSITELVKRSERDVDEEGIDGRATMAAGIEEAGHYRGVRSETAERMAQQWLRESRKLDTSGDWRVAELVAQPEFAPLAETP